MEPASVEIHESAMPKTATMTKNAGRVTAMLARPRASPLSKRSAT